MKTNTKRTGVTITKRRVTKIVTPVLLGLIKQGYYAKQIADELKTTPRVIHYHLKKIQDQGLITPEVYSSCKVLKLTEDGEIALKRSRITKLSYSTTREVKGIHDLYIKIPIIHSGAASATFWDHVNTRMKNNYQKHRYLGEVGASIRETSKHICIQLRPRTLENYDQVYGLITGVIGYVLGQLTPEGYVLDYMHPVVKGLHLTYEDQHSHDLIEKGLKVKVMLGRSREKLTPRDPDQQAFVLLDKTPTKNWETNDHEHAKLRAMEPENVARLVQLMEQQNQNMAEYAEHLKSHTQFIRGAAGIMKKLDSRLSQRKLGEFL